MTKFWTAGQVQLDSTNKKVIAWEGYSGEPFPIDSKERTVAWEWSTSVPTTHDFENCVSIGTQFIGERVKGLERMAIHRTSCQLPHFFICSEESSCKGI